MLISQEPENPLQPLGFSSSRVSPMQNASRGEKRRLFEATPLLLCPSRSPGAHTWLTHLLLPASKAATKVHVKVCLLLVIIFCWMLVIFSLSFPIFKFLCSKFLCSKHLSLLLSCAFPILCFHTLFLSLFSVSYHSCIFNSSVPNRPLVDLCLEKITCRFKVILCYTHQNAQSLFAL